MPIDSISSRLGSKKISFTSDKDGLKPPSVYLNNVRKLGISHDEIQNIGKNIEKASMDVDRIIRILRGGSLGPEAKDVYVKYLEKNPGLNAEVLSNDMKKISEHFYRRRMNISLSRAIYRGETSSQKYKRAPHQKLFGRKLFSADPDILNVEMARSAITGPDGARHIIGTIATPTLRLAPKAADNFLNFIEQLNQAYDRDLVQMRISQVQRSENWSDITQLDSRSTSSHGTDAVAGIIDLLHGKTLDGAAAQQAEHKQVAEQIDKLYKNEANYSADDRGAIAVALLKDLPKAEAVLEDLPMPQQEMIHRSLQQRARGIESR